MRDLTQVLGDQASTAFENLAQYPLAQFPIDDQVRAHKNQNAKGGGSECGQHTRQARLQHGFHQQGKQGRGSHQTDLLEDGPERPPFEDWIGHDEVDHQHGHFKQQHTDADPDDAVCY